MCCVDNAEAREVLNHLAYANCLPLIDGGILVESRDRLLSAKWRIHLVGPDMRCLRCRAQYTSGDARDERMGIRSHGRYIDDAADGPEPGQNTLAFCTMVAAEQMRILVRYATGEDWWHDGASTAGQWSFEHRFVEAETDPFKHPGRCAASCEFTHLRLGLGEGGRPSYPLTDEPQDSWITCMRYRYRQLRMRFGRARSALCT